MEKVVFFIGGAFPKSLDPYFEKKYYKKPDVSSLVYGRDLVDGLLKTKCGNRLVVFSVPQVGAFPFLSKKEWVFFESSEDNIIPVNYHSFFLVKHFSQRRSLIKQLKRKLISVPCGEHVQIIIENAYFPYLSAVNSILKKKKWMLDVDVIVPDLPEYVGSSASRKNIKGFIKRLYVEKTYNLLDKVGNRFVLFSPAMRDRKQLSDKPSFVSCGISLTKTLIRCDKTPGKLVFVGKLSKANMIREMVNGFMQTNNPSFSFDIVGDGEEMDFVKEAAGKDSRIHSWGFLSPEKADSIRIKASALIALRRQTPESAYSFPSKLVSALTYDVPVVSLDLPCFTDVVRSCLVIPGASTPEAISHSIEVALGGKAINESKRMEFIKSVNNVSLAEKIVNS